MQAMIKDATEAKWKLAFQEAVFELNPMRLQTKLEMAQSAVEERLGEALSHSGVTRRELMELEDALRTIRYLAKHELQA